MYDDENQVPRDVLTSPAQELEVLPQRYHERVHLIVPPRTSTINIVMNKQNIDLIEELIADAGWMSDDKFYAYFVNRIQQSINELKEITNLVTGPNRITQDELLEMIDPEED